MSLETKIREAVRQKYAGRASRPLEECCNVSCCGGSASLGVPAEALGLRAGCGSPLAKAGIRPGEVVLDLGSGGGADVFQASKLVGPSGKIIGVDSTPEMVWKAREIAKEHGFEKVEFRLGEIEHLPVESESVDVAISNCVLNLLPEKLSGFKEIYRVLKRGGRIVISDLVSSGSGSQRTVDPTSWAACVAGAIPKEDYLNLLQKAGFKEVNTAVNHMFDDDCCGSQNQGLESITVSAVKP